MDRPVGKVSSHVRRSFRRQPAFTLVELLTVIAIIAVLMAMLMPALNAARQQANAVHTQHTMEAAIAPAIEMWKNDHNDRLPRSGLSGDAVNPPDDMDGTDNAVGTGDDTNWPGFAMANAGSFMSGAHWLVYQLMGPDLKGYANPADLNGDGAINAADLALATREGPYLPTDKADVVRDNDPDLQMLTYDPGTGRWVGINPADRRITGLYILLDRFGFPILYYAGNPGRARNANAGVHDIFNINDNAAFTGKLNTRIAAPYAVDGVQPFQDGGFLGQYGASFGLSALEDGKFNPLGDYISDANQNVPPGPATNSWAWYLEDERTRSAASTRARPYNADGYLLISPGADGIYGNRDDVRNFPPLRK